MKVMLIVNTDGALYRFRKPIIKGLVSEGHTVVTLSSQSGYFDSIRSIGASPVMIDFDRHSIGIKKNLLLAVKISKEIKDQRPDIVHSFTHKPAIFGTLAAKFNAVKGIYITITGLGAIFSNDDLRSRLLRFVLLMQYRFALKFVDKIFFQNPDDMDMFIKRKIVKPSKAILTNGSGIDIEEFNLPNPEEIEMRRLNLQEILKEDLDGKKIVLFTARGVKEKGFFEFYEAAKVINTIEPKKYAFIHLGLVDVGTSNFISKDAVLEYANECGVFYLGFVENVRDYIVASDLMVLPSVYREGTPRSLIEALALGKAIVTTDMPGCRETIVDGWNGYLCNGSDTNSLVSKILLVDDEFLKAVAPRSRRLSVEKYDAKNLVALTIKCYKNSVH